MKLLVWCAAFLAGIMLGSISQQVIDEREAFRRIAELDRHAKLAQERCDAALVGFAETLVACDWKHRTACDRSHWGER